jgi:hypothetical protein
MVKHIKASTAIETVLAARETADAQRWALGAAAIGREIGRTAAQIHYMHEHGLLGDATFKLSHKILVGDRQRLRDLRVLAASKT